MNSKEESIQFQKSAMRFGTEFLVRDGEQSFALLSARRCNRIQDAVSILKMIPRESYPVLLAALPKRKPPNLLAAIGETMSEEERREIERYESLIFQVGRSDKLAALGNHKRILAQLVEEVSPNLGAFECSSDKEAYFFQVKFEAYHVKVILSAGGRNPEIDYHLSVTNAAGAQLNGFPLSLLEMCGLSTVTGWTATSNLSASEIVEDAAKCIGMSLDSVSKLMAKLNTSGLDS